MSCEKRERSCEGRQLNFEIREVSFGGRQMSCELKRGVIREDICVS